MHPSEMRDRRLEDQELNAPHVRDHRERAAARGGVRRVGILQRALCSCSVSPLLLSNVDTIAA